MKRFKFPHFVALCQSLHESHLHRLLYNGELTKPFETQTSVLQVYMLAPMLFNIFTAVLTIIVGNKLEEEGLGLRYRFDGGLFKPN